MTHLFCPFIWFVTVSAHLPITEAERESASPQQDKKNMQSSAEKMINEQQTEQESIALTNYYLKGSMQERQDAQNVQDEFMKTLNQMEKEDVPAHVIEEYKKAEILRKSMAVVKKHAQKMEDIRTSPDRYDKVKGKINT